MSNEAQSGDSQSQSALASLFLYRDFCVFWTGSFLSGIGTQFTTVAMAWQIYELTDSAFQIGLLGLARAVPQMILLLVAGLLIRGLNRAQTIDPGFEMENIAVASFGLVAAGYNSERAEVFHRQLTDRVAVLPGV